MGSKGVAVSSIGSRRCAWITFSVHVEGGSGLEGRAQEARRGDGSSSASEEAADRWGEEGLHPVRCSRAMSRQSAWARVGR